jgi:hypothetical protein
MYPAIGSTSASIAKGGIHSEFAQKSDPNVFQIRHIAKINNIQNIICKCGIYCK